MPILLYGSENWILTPELLKRLESFQGELAKRVLCWPEYHSNTSATMVVGLQSMQSRILEQKLSFLQRLLDNDTECVYVRESESMSKIITDLCLVRECKELEEVCGVECTERILMGKERGY